MPSRPDAVRELQQLLATVRSADRGPARTPETADTREQLRSLGYVSGSAAPKARFTAADDPKQLIDLDRAIEEVVSRYQRGDLPAPSAWAKTSSAAAPTCRYRSSISRFSTTRPAVTNPPPK